MKYKTTKKLIAMFSAVTVLGAVFGTSVFAEDHEEKTWRTYYQGENVSYKTDVVYLKYNNPVTNYIKATSITGTSTSVVITGTNVDMYDIPAGCYTAYAYTKVHMPVNYFRPYWKKNIVNYDNIGRYKCVSSGGGYFETTGYLLY